MSKLKAIKAILSSANYIVVTQTHGIASVSPLYADKFIDNLRQEQDALRLAQHKHNRLLDHIADEELGKL